MQKTITFFEKMYSNRTNTFCVIILLVWYLRLLFTSQRDTRRYSTTGMIGRWGRRCGGGGAVVGGRQLGLRCLYERFGAIDFFSREPGYEGEGRLMYIHRDRNRENVRAILPGSKKYRNVQTLKPHL